MLKSKIDDVIHQNGYITLEQYMALCLYDDEFGYYKNKLCIGNQGDFITAPEISQLFGETIAFWLAYQWQNNFENPKYLVELGPGHGTLMVDILTTLNKLNSVYLENLTIHLIEISPTLKSIQQQKLSRFNNINWHPDLGNLTTQLPKNYCSFIANEFFDAFPIQQLQWNTGCWYERVIISQPNNAGYQWTLAPHSHPNVNFDLYPTPYEGAIVEICPKLLIQADKIFDLVKRGNNVGLFIDYGYANFQYGDSFQAIYNHAYHDPLKFMGQCDLSAHVNFAALVNLAQSKNLHSHITSQQIFLKKNGIDIRLEKLLQTNPNQAQSILEGYNRLTCPDQMGKLFKALTINST